MSLNRPWWLGATLYQIYPRSFADSNGDGIGDLPGITEHLEHVASLGVDAIWLSPFFKSPMKDFGYDISDYRDVDPIFGTLPDFDRLIERAHALGLRVIIDQVYSHTSDQHPWFRDSRASRDNPKADWYVWADAKPEGSPPNNWQSVFGGAAWAWDSRRGQYYLHNFLTEQPDLNVHNPAVQEALLDCARFWLERGVDGFRVDAINYAMHDLQLRDNPAAPASAKPRTRSSDFQQPLYNKSQPGVTEFIQRVRALTDRYPDRFTVAEVGGENAEEEMQRFTAGTRHFHTAYGFNFLYADRLTPELVRQALQRWPAEGTRTWPSWAFSNHDAPRAVSRWSAPADAGAAARLHLLLLLSLRGNVFLWQGEELGLPQAELHFDDLRDPEAIANWPLTLGRDGARTPMPWRAQAPNAGFSTARPWLPVPGVHAALAVDLQQRDPHSMLALTRTLIALRHTRPALLTGSIRFLRSHAALLAFERQQDQERLLCVFNLGTAAEHFAAQVGVRWEPLFTLGDVQAERGGWTLPGYGGLIAIAAS
ncbi:MAG: alpha-amylase family glycosyl hydrolase [Steroidobacteraceae bacterium]